MLQDKIINNGQNYCPQHYIEYNQSNFESAPDDKCGIQNIMFYEGGIMIFRTDRVGVNESYNLANWPQILKCKNYVYKMIAKIFWTANHFTGAILVNNNKILEFDSLRVNFNKL